MQTVNYAVKGTSVNFVSYVQAYRRSDCEFRAS